MLYNRKWDPSDPGNYRPTRYTPPPQLPERTWWGIGIAVGVTVTLLGVMAFTYAMNLVSPHYERHLTETRMIMLK